MLFTWMRWVIPASLLLSLTLAGVPCQAASTGPTISSASAAYASNGSVLINVTGSNFETASVVQTNGSNLKTAYVSATRVQATLNSPPGAGATLSLLVINPAPNAGQSAAFNVWIPASVLAATRLLDQTTFGATDSLIAHVQAVGLSRFLDEQLAAPASLMPALPNPLPARCTKSPGSCNKQNWWNNVMTGNDQLRQRFAFVLGQIFVISYNDVSGDAFPPFVNGLATDAFGNWAKIVKDVTLSPGMGNYLNMINSGKPAVGAIANENFARENMQLFNLGLYWLNMDGTLWLDSHGKPIPTFTQLQVEAFARAYTGWTYATSSGGVPSALDYWYPNYKALMVAVESEHDTTAKALLRTTLPAGQTAEQDLDGALADIFGHHNVPPFVCKQLIQHLVKSNPSPSYIERVASVFANNGAGVRGDMSAVLKAIFLDPEARAGDTGTVATDGHLREPILWMANVLRALSVVPFTDAGAYSALTTPTASAGEEVFRPPSVFNFYPPDYGVPGTTILGPEFGLETTATSIGKLNAASVIVSNELANLDVDLGTTSALGRADASSDNALLDELSKLFLHGRMTTQMRTTILNTIAPSKYIQQRVRIAVYLVITSSQYKIAY